MESTPVRAVLVGCGGISGAWLKAIQGETGIALVGLVDISEANIAKVAAAHGLTSLPRETDLGAMLARLRPDAVLNCTVPEAHLPVTLTALEYGCHVLGEKPLADTLEHARTMVDAADRAKRIFAVIQNRRYQAQIRSIRAFLAGGAIGRITSVNADFYIGAHFGGFRDRMQHVLLLDMAIHSFDQCRLLSGADPRAVYCHEWNPAGSWYDHDACAQCIFEMSHGIVFNYRGSWCCEGLNTSWECDWRIVGEKGCLTWNGGDLIRAQTVAGTGSFFSEMAGVEVPVAMPEGMFTGHKGCIMEFARCVRDGTTPETAAADNIRSLAMVFGAIDSATDRRRVEIRA
ncbi:MAG: Gfo/Idh/MocA family oxidoreductase [Lentisphaeria bacterium]|nr:Gfo/Idh/MocA family oxidoreductase [Lentisphaeria bacterium]